MDRLGSGRGRAAARLGAHARSHEDHFAAAVTRGFLGTATAAEIRAEGERVIAERPWPTGWEDWRPPPEWEALPLPEDWHVV
ncbi:MAG TPA: hypothetical protein VMU72_07705 [Gaiellaceae bacterium]|nr:hypothetical protein [Gaiellaceae bacterium]